MSHFTVMVVGGNVEEQLAPFHEFECTGDDNCYVQDIDQTEEARAEYLREGNTTPMLKDTDGNLHSPYTEEGEYDQAYWRDPTPEESLKHSKMGFNFLGDGVEKDGLRWASADWKDGKGYRAKVFALPSGWTEVEVPESSVKSFAEFCEDYYGHKIVPFGEQPELGEKHKYGYTLVDEKGEVVKTVNRTNPSKKRDWYQVGGRWNGYFKLKSMAVGVLGESSLMKFDDEPPTEDRADVCLKGDIDIEGMRDEAGNSAAERYDLLARVTAGLPKHTSWGEVQKQNRTGKMDEDGEPEVNWRSAREQYGAQPVIKALRENEGTLWFDADNFLVTREEYIENARNSAFATFALIKDGKWYERGDMGWWGIVRDEKDRDEWNQQFSKLIDDLPDETILTVVDCHI